MSLGAFIVRRRTGQHDQSIPNRHFSVRKPPIGRREASCLRETKHFGQPPQGGDTVLIGQEWNHVWHLVLHSPYHEVSNTKHARWHCCRPAVASREASRGTPRFSISHRAVAEAAAPCPPAATARW